MKNLYEILIFTLILISTNKLLAQQFTEIDAGLRGVAPSSVAWGDYDNDGDLDILLTGYTGSESLAKIYKNDGNNNFSDINANLDAISYGSSGKWGDYDGDGDLDILLAGRSSTGNITKIFKNNGNGTFSEQTSINLIGVENAAFAWGDYDNDGDLDILLTGKISDNPFIPVSKIYKNNGNNTFTEQTNISLTAVDNGAVSWADYDKDGDLDIFLTGYNDIEQAVSKIYRNNGNETFTEQTGISLAGVSSSAVALGDYDDDGYLDILLTGYNFGVSGPISKLYKNNGNNIFTEQTSVSLTAVLDGSVAWGDYDNDGDLDILLSGNSNSEGRISKIYENNGDNTFTEQIDAILIGMSNSSASWGDYDNDKDLDILLSGNTDSEILTKIYRNNCALPNTKPGVPTNLNISINGDDVTFSWNYPSDNETHSNGLSFNIRIGTSSGASDLKPPMADLDSAHRSIPVMGNVGQRNSWTVKNLPKGIYYWSVQAVDNGFLSSEFSPEKVFIKDVFEESDITYDGEGVPKLGDYDNDGDLDILSINNRDLVIYKRTENSFTKIDAELPSSIYTSDSFYEWGDYDNDGDLDIAFAGYNPIMSKIYRNDRNDIFTDIEAGLLGVWMCTLVWGDYDNDGDLDLFLYGSHEFSDDGEPIGKLYRNDGNDIFVDSEIPIEHSRRGAVALADYNKDGYLDILVCGINLSQNIFTSILKNAEGSVFMNINTELARQSYSSLSWGDYDNDSFQDIFLSGERLVDDKVARIYRNNGDDTFSDIGASLKGSTGYDSNTSWGDFDNDGDLDILVSGGININQGNGNFSVIDLDFGLANWGDIDNDGDLDIVSEGMIYINTIEKNNTCHTPPDGLKVQVQDNEAILSWNKITDDITPSAGISYNVRIGSNPGRCDILSPMVDTLIGFKRTIPGFGNAGVDTFKIIKELPVGAYYWSVQAIDQAWLASDFAPESTFNVFPMYTIINDIRGSSWGDYDNDGDLDILQTGTVFRNDGNGLFYDIQAGINGSNDPANTWCDYDNDGDLDIITKDSVFRNDQGDVFTNTGILFAPSFLSFEPGDYDADGDNDIVSIINNDGNISCVIYRNDGNDTFTEIDLNLIDLEYGAGKIIWADYDNDGDFDIILSSGYSFHKNFSTKIFKNDGNNNFTDIKAGLLGLGNCAISLADYDNDKDLDLLMVGTDNNYNHYSKIYRNDGNDSFVDILANIRGYSYPRINWGDYNNNGYQDIIISGSNNGRIRTKLYHNNADGTFTEKDALVDYENDVYDCGDYDNDGDLDLLTHTGLFRNNTNYPNIKPQALSNLKDELKGFDFHLSWDKATDDHGSGYSYNLRIGTTTGGCEIKAPMANHLDGYRRSPTKGNIQSNTSWVIKNLPVGTYYWSVQAISQNYTGGDWAPEQTFEMPDISASFNADTVCFGLTTSFTDNSLSPEETIISWIWDFGDGNTSTVQNPTHQYALPGIYSVTLNIQTESYSHNVTKDVIVLASPNAIFSVDTVCQGSMTTYINTSQAEGLTVLSWKWDLGDGTDFHVQYPPKHGYLNPGTYPVKLIISAENGCVDSVEQNAIVVKIPSSTITYVGGACYDTISRLLAEQNPLYNYQWYYNDVIITGETSYSVHPLQNGSYKVDITSLACQQSSALYVLNYTSGPAVPEMYLRGPVVWYIACSDTTAAIYKWYKNDTEIPNSNKQIIVPKPAEGSYYVELNDGGECWTKSETVVIPNDLNSGKFKSFENLGSLGDVESGMAIFPNPNDGKFSLIFKNDFTDKIYLRIKDIRGKTIRQYYADKALPVYFEEMDLNKYGAGVYFIEIEYDGKKMVKKIVVE